MAQGRRRADRPGRRRPAGRHSARRSRTCSAPQGVRTTACSHILDNFVPTYESTVSAQSVARRRGAARQDQQRRIRHGLVERDIVHRAGDLAVAAKGREHAAGARRLLGRLGRGRGGAPGARRDRHRHRRLDPPAGGVHRHRRTSSRPTAAARAGASSRSRRRSTRPGRLRARCATRRSCCARWPGTIRRTRPRVDRRGAGLRGGGRQVDQGHADRHPEGIPGRRHVGGDRRAVGAGRGLAQGCGRRTGRGVAAAHQIRAAGLLHRRAGGGVVQSRALRRRALRPARARPRHHRHVREHARAAASARRCAAAS